MDRLGYYAYPLHVERTGPLAFLSGAKLSDVLYVGIAQTRNYGGLSTFRMPDFSVDSPRSRTRVERVVPSEREQPPDCRHQYAYQLAGEPHGNRG